MLTTINKSLLPTVTALLLCILPLSGAEITEREFAENGLFFQTVLNQNNPGMEQNIQASLYSTLAGQGSGVRLIDRFGLFMYDCRRNSIDITRTKYFAEEKGFSIFIVLTDRNDGQQYTCYMDFSYDRKRDVSAVRDIYFSLVFTDRISTLKELFLIPRENTDESLQQKKERPPKS